MFSLRQRVSGLGLTSGLILSLGIIMFYKNIIMSFVASSRSFCGGLCANSRRNRARNRANIVTKILCICLMERGDDKNFIQKFNYDHVLDSCNTNHMCGDMLRSPARSINTFTICDNS